ncbi:MAG: hypothetical protein LOD90_05445 [Symbiobacteriaceae bacterium]
MGRLDLFDRLEFLSFRDPGVARDRPVDLRRALLWPLLPLLGGSRLLGFGQPLYDFIARRRRVMPAGKCGAGCSRAGGR